MPSEEQTPLVLRRHLVTGGWTDDELARARRSGGLSRVRRGAYVEGAVPTAAAVRHHLLVRATVAGLRRDAVVSHESAAVLHGLPAWGLRPGRVHVTRRPPASSDVSRTLRCHVARLGDDEVTTVGGIPVTGPVRTALDLARCLPFEVAVVALDGLLAARPTAAGALQDGLARAAGIRGSRAAARAVAFADGRSESVGESRSRVLLHRLGWRPATSSTRCARPTGRCSAEPTSRGRPGGCSGSSTGGWSTGGCCDPPVRWPTASGGPCGCAGAPAREGTAGVPRALPALQHRQCTRNARNPPRERAGAQDVRAGGPPTSR